MNNMRLLKGLFPFLLPLAVVLIGTGVCYANPPPPPSVFIIVPHAPKSLTLSIGSVTPQIKQRAFDTYYGFYFQWTTPNDNILQVTDGDNTFEIAVPPLQSYSSTFTLDLNGRSLTSGAPALRPYEFAAITIVLTLVIEGIIFYLFGYRKKASWIAFLITNLITQGFLYVWLNKGNYPSVSGYGVTFDLILGEFLVVIIEAVVLLIAVRERSRLETFLYVIMANLVSAIAGGFLVSALI